MLFAMPCPFTLLLSAMKKIELAMPAGTLEEALIALRSGADAVYFGMKEFSARKGAGNFSEEDLAKIRQYSLENGKKTYIAVNTLVDDASLGKLTKLLDMISHYGTDGVIVQDLGVVNLMRKLFPSLPIHGSTQLAVHTVDGVKMLQDLGFERVVLSRELSLDEISDIRKACPDIELKVFIHGALCYGFSGLCMASHIITGRSANEGACAQICRSWFRDSNGRKCYPFSLEDLDGAELVKMLMDIGIDSLKVEGRLKGPDYSKAVAEYYRAAIDGKDFRQLEEPAAASFRRKSGTGWLLNTDRRNMQTGRYTGHRGYSAGKITAVYRDAIEVQCRTGIFPHDGLMMISEGNAYRFRPEILRKNGNTYTLRIEDTVSSDDMILYKISDSRSTPPSPSTDTRQAKRKADAVVSITESALTIKTDKLSKTYEIDAQVSENDGTASIRKIFSQSGNSMHQLAITEIENNSRFSSFYISPKRLKEIRRDFLAEYDAMPDKEIEYTTDIEDNETMTLPDRNLLSGKDVPWNTDGIAIDGRTWFTLPPVRFDEKKLYSTILDRAKPGDVIGMNNIADIRFAKEHPEFSYFADIYLYLSNREAAALIKEQITDLIGGYLWIERDSYEKPWPFTPTIAENFQPPLFISRAWTEEGIYEQNGRRYSVKRADGLTITTEI